MSFTISPERLELLQLGWAAQLTRFGVLPVDAYRPFDDLVARYQEPHRHYHNLEHIGEVLKVIGKLSDAAPDTSNLFLAAWYHDAVYDPRAKDNEQRSADLARTQLSALGLPGAMLDQVAAMILATAHGDVAIGGDASILVDADLAILAAEANRYRRYSEAIRAEYDWVDDAQYRSGRARVLEVFLNRERIYQTERMRAVAEEPARINLRAELASLTQ
jgi:predicted metal-dependent HD superfamily phosphohydrolase